MKRWTILIVAVVLVGGVAWWASRNSSSETISIPKSVDVTYKVEGTARTTDITYQASSGTAQQSGIDVPVTRKSDGHEGLVFSLLSGSHAYLSAQNAGSSGDITCIIEANGHELARNTSSGGSSIATCTATVP